MTAYPADFKCAVRPRDRLMALSPERQAQLLDPAEREFADKGFVRASLNQILKAAGMSKGQAYYYFQDKADLYGLVIDRAFDTLTRGVGGWHVEAGTAEDFWARIETLFTNVTLTFMQNETLARIGRSIYLNTEAEVALTEHIRCIDDYLLGLIETGQSIGAMRTDIPTDLLAGVLFATVRELDRWCALNINTLSPNKAARLNTLAFGMIRNLAAPLTGTATIKG